MINSFEYATETSQGARPPCSLLVVDDQKIRLALFANTATLLKKLNKLERDFEAFQNQDQRLYEDWYNLTFRRERQQEEQVDRRLQNLRTFKTHLEYLVETSKISPAKAYLLLQDEEKQYQRGDEDWRFVIDMLRQQRLENAKKIRNQKLKAQSQVHNTGRLFKEEDVSEQTTLASLNRKERTTFYYLKEIREESLVQRFNDTKIGFTFFKESFQVAMKGADWSLLAKIWKCSHKVFQERLLKSMPLHLQEFLSQVLQEHSETSHAKPVDPYAEEVFMKTSYRKLVRILHPDTFVEANNFEMRDWLLKTWQKVQEAYQKRDAQKLKRLEFMVELQLGHLNSLTMDEIYESSLLFAEELENLKKKIRAFRKHPAWNFSSRRGYDSLTARTRMSLMSKLQPKLDELKQLEAWLENLHR